MWRFPQGIGYNFACQRVICVFVSISLRFAINRRMQFG